MKKTLILISVILATLFFLAGSAIAEVETRGNSIGNVANHGTAAEGGGSVYFSLSNKGFYKMQADGGELVKICDEVAQEINIIGETIYCILWSNDFSKSEDYKPALYSMNTDGSGRKKLSDDYAVNMNVFADWIYFANDSDEMKPYRIKTDGTSRTKLNNLSVSCLNVVGEWIYFENHNDDTKLYKMKTDGTNVVKICDDGAYYLDLNVIEDWIYYTADKPEYGLYKIKTDGTGKEKLGLNASRLNVNCEWIYYSITGDALYRIKTDGSGKQRLLDGRFSDFCIAGDWIYYRIVSDYSTYNFKSFCRTKIDGSETQIIYGEDIIKEIDNVRVVVSGKKVTFDDVIISKNNRTLLPLRAILIALGVKNDDEHIIWNGNNKSVTIIKDDKTIELQHNNNTAFVNGKAVLLDVAPTSYKNGRTYIPVRFVAQTFGKSVLWDGSAYSILINDNEEYEKNVEILSKSDLAMASLKRYKSLYERVISTAADSKEFSEDGKIVINYEVDNENNEISKKYALIYNESNKKYEGEQFYSKNSVYMNNPLTAVKIIMKYQQKEYQEMFFQNRNRYKLHNNVYCTGLHMEESDSEIVMEGDLALMDESMNSSITKSNSFSEISTDAISGQFDFSEYHLRIVLNKDTYVVKSISALYTTNTEGKITKVCLDITYNTSDNGFRIIIPEGYN